MEADQTQKRGRGRPPGSKNKAPLMAPPLVEGAKALDDYKHADPHALLSRMFSMVDWGLKSLDFEMRQVGVAPGKTFVLHDLERMVELSTVLVRAIDGLRKYNAVAEEFRKTSTPEQLLEWALKKIEGQDVATINYAIKRLRAYREKLGPVQGHERHKIGNDSEERGVDAITSLDAE